MWHLEPSLTDPDTVYAGVEDAALFRSTDGGTSWKELPGLRGHGTGPHWQPGAGGMCLHTIILDPSDPSGSISPSPLRAHSAPTTAAQHGSRSTRDWFAIHTRTDAEVGHCVHHVAMHPSRPGVLFMQKHWDVMRSDNAGDFGTRSVEICQPILASSSTFTPMSRRRFMLSRSRAMASTFRPRASYACIAAAAAETNGRR